jgi:hypothetical protein
VRANAPGTSTPDASASPAGIAEPASSESDLWPLGGPPQPRWLLIIGVAAGVGATTAILFALAIRRRLRTLGR